MFSGNRSFLIYTALVLSTVQWGLSFPFFYIVLNIKDVPPMFLATIRFTLMIPLILVFLYVQFGYDEIIRTVKQYKWIILVFGLLNASLSNIFQNIGMTLTTPAISSIIQTTGPIFVVIMAVFFLKEGMNKFKLIGIIFTVVGSLLLITGWRFDIELGSLLGNLLVLASALSYAISSVVAKNTIRKVKPFLFVGLGMIAGALILIVNSVVLHFAGVESMGAFMDFDLETWAFIAYLSIGPGLIALFAWYYVMEHMQVSRQTFFVYLVPIFGIFFSWAVVSDTLSWEQAFFTAVIIFGVIISQLRPKKLAELPDDKQPPKYFGP